MSERWPDANLAGFEIRYGHSDETGGNTADPGGDGGTTEPADGGDEADDGAADGGDSDENGTETDDGETGDAEASDDDPPECDFGDWPPDEVESHDVRLVNRKAEQDDTEGETPEEDTTLYASADVDVEGDAPYLINTFERCESDFVGVELESVEGGGVEQDDDPEEVEDDPNEPQDPGQEDTPAEGPGFGVLGALTAVIGLGHLLDRRRPE